MKLSWLNTSEAHTNNTSIYKIWQYDAMLKVKERELEKVDQSHTHGYVSRFEHTEGFSRTCPHRTPTQGTSTEDLGQYNNRECTTPLSNTTQPLHLEARHKATNINHLTQEGQALSQHKSISSHLRDSNTISTFHQRELNTTSIITSHLRDINSITSHQRNITKMEGYNLVVYLNDKPNLSH